MADSYLQKAFFEGSIIDFKDAKVSIATSALQYGIGCFAGIRGYKQDDGTMAIFRLDRHAQRLYESIKMLDFRYNTTPEKLAEIITDTVTANNPDTDIYIRPFVYRSDTTLGPRIEGEYELAVYVLPLTDYLPSEEGLKLMTSSWVRVPDHAIPMKSKASGGYIGAALSIEEAKQHGFDSSIMLDIKGDVGEGVVMNLFTVREGQIITPGLGGDLLEGVTRRSVVELAEMLDIPVQQSTLKRSQLYNADEVFVTGTAVQIGWVKSIDNRIVSDAEGSITQRIHEAFEDSIRGKSELSKKWLTRI